MGLISRSYLQCWEILNSYYYIWDLSEGIPEKAIHSNWRRHRENFIIVSQLMGSGWTLVLGTVLLGCSFRSRLHRKQVMADWQALSHRWRFMDRGAHLLISTYHEMAYVLQSCRTKIMISCGYSLTLVGLPARCSLYFTWWARQRDWPAKVQ